MLLTCLLLLGALPQPAAAQSTRKLKEAETLSEQASKLYNERHYDEAITLTRQVIDILTHEHGPDSPHVGTFINNLGLMYSAKGDAATAVPLYERAAAIIEKAKGPKDALLATILGNLGLSYYLSGDLVRAEPPLQRAIAIDEEVLGAEHTMVGQLTNNLAVIYGARGEVARAEALYQRVLAIYEKTLGADNPAVAQTLTSLATLYTVHKDYDRAEATYDRAYTIYEKTLAPTDPTYITFVNNVGQFYSVKGDYEMAAKLMQVALDLSEKSLGPDHPLRALTMMNLAAVEQSKGDLALAGQHFEGAIALYEKILGGMHPDLANAYENAATLYEAKDETARALVALAHASDIREHTLALVLTTGSERQKLAYMGTFSFETAMAVSLNLRQAASDPAAARMALTTVLRLKGRALDAVADQIGNLRRRLDPAGQTLLDQLSATRAQLATITLAGAGQMPAADRQAASTKLEAELERLEAQVSARSAEFSTQAHDVTLAPVQAALPPGAALVELVAYRPFNAKTAKRDDRLGQPRYAAYVLKREGAPTSVDLGAAADIERAVTAFRAALKRPDSKNTRALGRALDEQVMRPVRQLLGDTRQLFLSPDGALNLIPFAALVDEQDHYLIENYQLTYLTSGRDLLRLQVRSESKSAPLVLANPQFDLGSAGPGAGVAPERGLRSADLGTLQFSALKGTAEEAAALKTTLAGAQVLTEGQATEAALKQLNSPAVLHIATHGFFLPDQTLAPPAATETRGLALGDGKPMADAPAVTAAPTPTENPLLRSGIALAGANRRQSGAGEDGVLTALEAVGLNLWGTRLVVLSACETGLGDVQSGEGVYGLRRALVLAGSEAQVMSLWQVSDAATRDLMVAYYRRLQGGEGRTEALRQVQLAMIKSAPQGASADAQRGLGGELGATTKTTDRSHPFYWASFIQSGAWTAMTDKTSGSK
ncbi:MAG: CHAT domain-containing tetratricopeptide repeat protein [Pyrinomonadaceae bacterium]